MPTRQHILLGVFLVGLASYLGYWGYESLIVDRIESKTKSIERTRKSATSKKREVIESRAAKLQLEKWKKLSLPADPNVATPQYQAFLLDLLEQSGFDRPTINPGRPSMREKTYWRIPFEVQTRGSMTALVTFLDAFYQTQLLHKVIQLSMTPSEANAGAAGLELRFTIEALALAVNTGPEPTRDLVPKGSEPAPSDKTASGPFAQVLDRNLLMRHGPGPAGRPSYQSSQVYLTGTILSAKQPEALLYNRATGESMTWHLGDQVAAGDVRGELVDIATSEIVLAIGSQWFTIGLGENLGSRKPLTAEEALSREIRRSRSNVSQKAD